MAYGTTLARAYYGAGDYQSRAALRGIGYNASSYYAAGGFFGNLVKKGLGAVAKVAGNPLVQTGLSFLPGGGILAKGASIASNFLGSGAGQALVSGLGGKVAKLAGKAALGGAAGAAGAMAVNRLLEKPKLAPFGGPGGAPRRRRSSSSRRRRRSSSSRRSGGRKRRRGSYARGDWGDPGGRDQRGHYLNDNGGHKNFRRKRRRGRRAGQRVSFTTKDGRRVSFTAKGDHDGLA